MPHQFNRASGQDMKAFGVSSPHSGEAATKDAQPILLTRELLSATPVSALFSALPHGVRMSTEAELESSLQAVLRGHDVGTDVRVFGYGSLMWNPAFEHASAQKASIYGWHRSFCLRAIFARGTPEAPGAMLALDRGGCCEGVMFCIPAAHAIDELMRLWKREMVTGVYQARWVTAHFGGMKQKALTFVVNRSHERYLGRIPMAQAARLINSGRGNLGTSREYFEAMIEAIGSLGLKDHCMTRLHQVLLQEASR